MKRLSYSALAIALAFAAPAMAQRTAMPSAAEPTQTMPATQAAPMTSSPATDARSAGADASVTTGMPVRDNTGAFIGSVSGVQDAPSGGGQVATIKMGAQTFTVATNALMISGGTATINASEAQIENMIPKK
jgi:hypothetical protein